MRKSTWRRAIALAFVAALLLSACSSDDDGGGTTSATASGGASDIDTDGVVKVGYDLSQSGVNWNYNPLDLPSGNTASNDGLWAMVYGLSLIHI